MELLIKSYVQPFERLFGLINGFREIFVILGVWFCDGNGFRPQIATLGRAPDYNIIIDNL